MCNELEIGHSAELRFEKGQYSGDCHLLVLLFDMFFIDELAEYPAVEIVSDINALSARFLSQAPAVVVLCELARYSSCDLVTFADCVKQNQLRLFTISAANLQLLIQYGLHHPDHVLQLSVRIREPSDFIQRVKTANRRIACDLHSTQLRLNPSLLLPSPLVPAGRLDSNQNSRLSTAGQKLSWLQRVRYPLAVTKRHVKNCLQELRAYKKAGNNGQGETSSSGVRETKLVQIRPYLLELQGTVFLATFNSFDYGSDWSQLVTAFCIAMRDNSDATLVLWATGKVDAQCKADLHHMLCTIAPFECSVALVLGELTDEDLYSLFSAASFVLNVEMYPNLRLDTVAASACGIPVISAANSSVDMFNKHLIYRCLETDEQPASPDRSADPVYSVRHWKVVWEDLQEQIITAYQLARNGSAYKDAQLLQWERFKQLSGQSLSDHNC